MNAILDTLGTIGETLDRPGAALRGLLAGRPGQLGYLVPGAESMGLVDPAQRTSGRDLLRKWGLAGEEDTLGNLLGGMGAEIALNPLPLMAGLGAKLGSRLLTSGSRYKDLKGLRQSFPMAYDVDPQAETIGRIVGGNFQSENRAMGAAGELLDLEGAAHGVWSPVEQAGAVALGAPPATARHEIMHGLIGTAAEQGGAAIDKLPFLPRQAARLMHYAGPERNFSNGMGLLTDELAAHAAETPGLLGQVQNAGRFLFNTRPQDVPYRDTYRQIASEVSPLAGEIYRQVGWAPAAAAGAGLGGLGAWALTGRGQ